MSFCTTCGKGKPQEDYVKDLTEPDGRKYRVLDVQHHHLGWWNPERWLRGWDHQYWIYVLYEDEQIAQIQIGYERMGTEVKK